MRRALLLLLLAFAFTPARAQSDQAHLENRLLDKALYLRGCWQSDHLRFDAAGKLIGNSPVVSFTVSGIQISQIRLQGSKLLIDGRRMGIRFKGDLPEHVPLNIGPSDKPKDEQIHLEIAAPAAGDYSAPLTTIFAENLADLAPTLPAEWQIFAQRILAPADAPPRDRQRAGPAGVRTAPRVQKAPEPEFSEYARRLKVGGNSLIQLTVDPEGAPTEVRILRPIGLGLDEKAVQAVLAYRFVPATLDGAPVSTQIRVEVNFQIF